MWSFLSCSFLINSCMVTCVGWWTGLTAVQNTTFVFSDFYGNDARVKLNKSWWKQTHFCPFWYLAATQDILVLWQWLFSVPLPTHANTHTQMWCDLCPSAHSRFAIPPLCVFSWLLYIPISSNPPQHWDEVSAQLEVTPVDRTNGPKLAGIVKKKTKKNPTPCVHRSCMGADKKTKQTSCVFEHTPKMTGKHSIIAKLLVPWLISKVFLTVETGP